MILSLFGRVAFGWGWSDRCVPAVAVLFNTLDEAPGVETLMMYCSPDDSVMHTRFACRSNEPLLQT